jgi:hypothetical protein
MSACERLDQAEAHADVALGPEVLAGIEHLAALDDEVELVVRAHGGERGGAAEACGRQRQSRGRPSKPQKLAARGGGHGCFLQDDSCLVAERVHPSWSRIKAMLHTLYRVTGASLQRRQGG